MTDSETLFRYRFNQAQESLAEAKRMLIDHYSSRAVINCAYYAAFYALLALFIKPGFCISPPPGGPKQNPCLSGRQAPKGPQGLGSAETCGVNPPPA